LLAALNVAYRDFRYVIPFLVQIWMFATPTLYMQTDAIASDVASGGTRGRATGVEVSSTARATPGEQDQARVPSSSSARPQADREGTSKGPGLLHTILALNPMTGLIGAFRAAALGQTVNWGQFSLSALSATIMFLVGCFYFRRVEDGFVDII
jgi:lipopolysaccharide transport system permease protein